MQDTHELQVARFKAKYKTPMNCDSRVQLQQLQDSHELRQSGARQPGLFCQPHIF